MLILEYCPEGICVADAKTMEYATGLVLAANGDDTIHVKFSQAMIFDALRVLVHRGIIHSHKIKVMFEGSTMTVHPNGRVSHWPQGFCDYTEDYLMELI